MSKGKSEGLKTHYFPHVPIFKKFIKYATVVRNEFIAQEDLWSMLKPDKLEISLKCCEYDYKIECKRQRSFYSIKNDL